MTDPEIQAEVDRAVSELSRRLRPWAVAMADPQTFAATFIADMCAEGWRVPLRPPPEPVRRVDPETAAEVAHRGAEMVRRELHNTPREDTDQ